MVRAIADGGPTRSVVRLNARGRRLHLLGLTSQGGVHAQLTDGSAEPGSDLDEDLEIDEDFLRRVREA